MPTRPRSVRRPAATVGGSEGMSWLGWEGGSGDGRWGMGWGEVKEGKEWSGDAEMEKMRQ